MKATKSSVALNDWVLEGPDDDGGYLLTYDDPPVRIELADLAVLDLAAVLAAMKVLREGEG